ncbi:MAG: arsenate reductase ArsC [Methanothrix sp.]
MSTKSQDKKEVLFLCTHNSARSHMAEGLLRAIYGERHDAYSAGVEATSVDPRAVMVMKEIGFDISGQCSKSAEEFRDMIFDLAVTVCDRAKQVCPICSTQLELPTKDGRDASGTRATPPAGLGPHAERLPRAGPLAERQPMHLSATCHDPK